MIKTKNILKSISLLIALIFVVAACGSSANDSADYGFIEEGRGESGFGGDAVGLAEPMMAPAAEKAVVGIESDVAMSSGADGFSDESLAQAQDRIVLKNANLSISVEDPAASMDEISQMAESMGGFVVSSNLYQTQLESGVEVPSANITVRVPSDHLLEALESIEELSTRVISKNQSGQDVTREYTDLKSRLRNLENAEDQLREIMASATKTEDVLNVYNRLTQITQEIEVVKGQIQYYDQSSTFSAISVSIAPDAAFQSVTIGGWQPVGVAKDAVQALINTLQVLVNAAIWIIIYVLPSLLAIGVPLWLIVRATKKFRKRNPKKPKKEITEK